MKWKAYLRLGLQAASSLLTPDILVTEVARFEYVCIWSWPGSTTSLLERVEVQICELDRGLVILKGRKGVLKKM